VPIESIASHIPQAGNSSSSGIRRSKVRELLDADAASRAPLGELVRVSGWIRTRRDQKSAAFLQVNDGSSVGGIQVILDKPPVAALNEVETARLAELMSGLTTGASVDIEGVLVRSPGKGQALEILVSAKNATADPSTKGTDATIRHESPLDFINRSVRLVGACPSDTYPLQKKRHSMEFLREMPHFRVRTNTIGMRT
jgi:asparaginyl-tRNA synthetase